MTGVVCMYVGTYTCEGFLVHFEAQGKERKKSAVWARKQGHENGRFGWPESGRHSQVDWTLSLHNAPRFLMQVQVKRENVVTAVPIVGFDSTLLSSFF